MNAHFETTVVIAAQVTVDFGPNLYFNNTKIYLQYYYIVVLYYIQLEFYAVIPRIYYKITQEDLFQINEQLEWRLFVILDNIRADICVSLVMEGHKNSRALLTQVVQ